MSLTPTTSQPKVATNRRRIHSTKKSRQNQRNTPAHSLFFDNALAGYSGRIVYIAEGGDSGNAPGIQWNEYFHDGKSVWSTMEPQHCDDKGCLEAVSEIQYEMTRPYDVLSAEAQSYLQLRGALKPTDR